MQQNFWLEFAPGSDGGLDTANEPSVIFTPQSSRQEVPDTLTAIYQGVQEGVIDETLASLLNVKLGSKVAQQLRDDYGREDRQERARQDAINTRLQALNQLLDTSEGGEADAWFGIWDTVLIASWPSASSWGGASRLDDLGVLGSFRRTHALAHLSGRGALSPRGNALSVGFYRRECVAELGVRRVFRVA
jgi:hypothetical protein